MRRAVAAVLIGTGLALVLVAVLGAVVLGPRGEWRAQGTVSQGAGAVVVRPSLAAVLGPRVALRVEASDPAARLFLGRARPDDARALAAGVPSAEVAGLQGPRGLDVRSVGGGASAPLPAPAGLDLWRQTAEGTGSASIAWSPSPGAESFVVTRADGAALPSLHLTMTWRDDSWRLLPLGVLAGGGALMVAGLLLRRAPRSTRRTRRTSSTRPTRRTDPAQPTDTAQPTDPTRPTDRTQSTPWREPAR
jgi:hypothetical protein